MYRDNESSGRNGRPSENRKSYGERKSYGSRPSRDGDKKPYGERKSYGDRPSRDGDRKPYGERKSYGDRPSRDGDRDRKPYGERKSYGDRPSRDGDRKPYGERKSYGDRPSRDGDRKPYGERKSYGDRPSRDGDRDRKPYGDRKSHGDRNGKFSNDRGGLRGKSTNRHDPADDAFDVGTYQSLVILRFTDFGAYLGYEKSQAEESESSNKNEASILLPKKYLAEGAEVGDKITVFIYKDSDDRLIATTETPLISKDKVAALAVKEVSTIGAFMDWNLDKDLLLPFREMEGRVQEGETVLVRMYVDKSGRPACTMRDIWTYMSQNAPYNTGDVVTGRVFELGHDFGTFVAVDDKYLGMIPRHEKTQNFKIGDVLTLHVTGVKEDGKLDLSLREEAYKEIGSDGEILIKLLESYSGVFPFSERATPEVILRETGLSKNAFKRAVGQLYKERKIDIIDGIIHLLSEKDC